MDNAIQFAGICGSLRKDSFNAKLLQSLTGLLPEGVTLHTAAIGELPHYNADLDTPAAPARPPAVEKFRNELAAAKALVIVSPEYNYSIPGVLKNAIDWASRGKDSPMTGKPIALLGVTPGMWGTVRMQQAFHSIFQFLNMKPVYQPEILIANAGKKFDKEGNFTDEAGKELIRKKLQALKELALQS